MSYRRFFLTGPAEDGVLPVSERDLHHARDVLRLREGERVVAVEPGGRVLLAEVTAIEDALRATVVEELPGETGPNVWLVAGVCKGERTDLAVRMAVEIGAAGVVPVIAERTIVRLDEDKRRARGDRWRRIAEEAAKQSGRAFVPHVGDPVDLSLALDALPDDARVLVPWEEADGLGLRAALAQLGASARTPVAVVIGPEGGLEPAEVAVLEAHGAVTCTLGPIVLRSETAAVVAVALVMHELGGLGGA